ncbi:hypothetical protein ACM39_17345 [Chryseobacterium sp. FH2]|uniref:hypothetical protein n=1 Tax=Chryseobacterium sp. FH2 TaxID=1674291 RepID=UPI00065A9630|nr:hypothetical protein [Chryseobacterium sp. FH2]KMQ62884.1 hypothetical protein ACM39_17345 [Chryseobacterium sp. FH2]
MKKIISLKIISLFAIIVLSAGLQSCRQDDENDLPRFEEKSRGKSSNIMSKDSDQSTSRDSISKAEEEDPPVKNGTHWRIKK